jgi:tetratricopeptide (TPR) repeat protein
MLSKQNAQEAEMWLQKGLAAGIGKDALLYQAIMVFILKRDTAQALKLLKEATEKYPTDLRYWTLQAELLLNQGDAEIVEHTILPEMQKALKTPNHFLIHAIRGFLLRNKGPAYFKEARLSLLKAVSLNAAMPDLWSAVFELDGALKTPEFTEADARNLLRTDPDHARANYLMGSSLLARGQVQESEDFLRRSIEKVPTAEACNDLGENLRLQKKLAEAERFARQALAIDPGLLPALDTLACIQFDDGKVDESAQTAAKAVAAKPRHPAYQLTLLRAQVRLGDKEGVAQRRKILAETQTAIPYALQKEINEMK